MNNNRCTHNIRMVAYPFSNCPQIICGFAKRKMDFQSVFFCTDWKSILRRITEIISGQFLRLSWSLFGIVLLTIAINLASGQEVAAPEASQANTKAISDVAWVPLLSKESFEASWNKTNFGGEGSVELVDSQLTLGFGQPMTGINYKKDDFPKDNYEVRWEAKRISGQDFFACVTLPIGEEFFSFIAGGWGGGLVGISSINGRDASDNDTTKFMSFDNDKWYRFSIRVTPENIKATIDDEKVVSVEREGLRFGLRMEVRASRPVGYCGFQSKVAVKSFEYRKLDLVKISTDEGKTGAVDKPVFFKVENAENGEPKALQTAIASYEFTSGPYKGAVVDLIGAVHVGEKSYYSSLNNQFKKYDAMLFELVADPDQRITKAKKDKGVYSPISAIQVGMKDALGLAFQLDEIDYKAKNFVHADMTPKEFVDDMKNRKDGFLSMFARVLGSSIAAQGVSQANGSDAKMLAALASDNRTLALRRVMADQFATMDIQMAGFADSQGKSTLLTERNGKAMQVLDRELGKGKRNIGIFYGAAHLDDMHDRLLRDFNATPGKLEWLDAWELSE